MSASAPLTLMIEFLLGATVIANDRNSQPGAGVRGRGQCTEVLPQEH